jgi:hypothetical protein
MIYYSHRTRKALAEGHTYLPLGFAHYSYGAVCRSFVKAFDESGVEASEILRPELYAHAQHIFPNRSIEKLFHISFKPFNEVRVLKGAYNVAHVYWEFGSLPTLGKLTTEHSHRSNILNDYVHVLNMVDEIWVGCNYTKRILESYSLNNVHVVPAPILSIGKDRDPHRRRAIELRRLGSLEMSQKRIRAFVDDIGSSKLYGSTLFKADECISGGGRIFLSVFNPGDPRKNAAAMMLGFQDYISHSARNDLLIIKLIIDDRPETFRTTLTEYLPRQFSIAGIPLSYLDCSNILVIPGRLSDQELHDLYCIADFYLCTSAAEGQGLPMQEAMAAGVVPISPCETAMQDYINNDNAIIIHGTEEPLPRQITDAYALDYGTWKIVNYREVSRGLSEAIELSNDEYTKLSERATQIIKTDFGREHVIGRVLDRLSKGL